jgi:C4-dicarboxylate-specific signal transduction histidine kinase
MRRDQHDSSELARLRQFGNHLRTLSDIKSVLELMVRAVMESQRADMGSAMLFDRGGGEPWPAVWIGFPEQYLHTVRRIPTDMPACDSSDADRGMPGADLRTTPCSTTRDAAARAAGYRTICSVPLCIYPNNALGILAVYFRHREKPSEHKISLMELYALLGAASIRNLQLAAQLETDREQFEANQRDLQSKVKRAEERRHALIHIMGDMNEFNKRLGNQRKAMLHILGDYERDRSRLGRQRERLDNSRRALMHILQDSHHSNLRLEKSRKAMIHIMGDLRETTAEIQRREHELRDKHEQLIQAGKLATLGELATGVAHELNNPLNNIGLFLGNAIDLIELGRFDKPHILRELQNAMQQVRKAAEIISHLRTFGRVAPATHELVLINQIIERAVSLMSEQLRLRQTRIEVDLSPKSPTIMGNAIQLEQVLINLLTNARDAMAKSERKEIHISTRVCDDSVEVSLSDTGPGIPAGAEQRIFDPFFTTKDVGAGTGLGLSITYGIINDHQGNIQVINRPGEGATFVIQLPRAAEEKLEAAI